MSGPRPPGSGLSADPHQCTAVDRQRHAGDEIGFVGSEKQRCIRDVPCCSHPATQRNLGIALRSDLGAAAVAGPSARVDGHWRIHESWQDAVGANAVWSVLQSELLGKGDHQLPPPGDWFVWLLLAGRGFGKTRSLSEFVLDNVASGTAKRVAVVAATAGDARDVLVEGESGILTISPSWGL